MRLRTSRIVDAPVAVVWDVLTDTEQWPQWGPTVAAVRAPNRSIRKGDIVRVRPPFMPLRLPFRIVALDAPSFWAWRIFGIVPTTHHVEALGPARARVTLSVPLLGWPYLLVCRRGLHLIAQICASRTFLEKS